MKVVNNENKNITEEVAKEDYKLFNDRELERIKQQKIVKPRSVMSWKLRNYELEEETITVIFPTTTQRIQLIGIGENGVKIDFLSVLEIFKNNNLLKTRDGKVLDLDNYLPTDLLELGANLFQLSLQ